MKSTKFFPYSLNFEIKDLYQPDENALRTTTEVYRKLQAETENLRETFRTLKEFALRSIADNYTLMPDVARILPDNNMELFTYLLPTDIDPTITAPNVVDGLYWRRCVKDRWHDELAFPLWYSRRSWKRYFIERYLGEYLENQEPGYIDYDEVGRVCKIFAPYVRALEIRRLRPPPYMIEEEEIPDVDSNTELQLEDFEEEVDDEQRQEGLEVEAKDEERSEEKIIEDKKVEEEEEEEEDEEDEREDDEEKNEEEEMREEEGGDKSEPGGYEEEEVVQTEASEEVQEPKKLELDEKVAKEANKVLQGFKKFPDRMDFTQVLIHLNKLKRFKIQFGMMNYGQAGACPGEGCHQMALMSHEDGNRMGQAFTTLAKTLKYITIHRSLLSDPDLLASIFRPHLRWLTALDTLDLSYCMIGDAGAEVLAQEAITKQLTLRFLRLKDNNIKTAGAKSIALALSAVNTPALRALNLSMNIIGTNGAKALAKSIVQNNRLREVMLVGCMLNDEAVLELIDSLRYNKTLHMLDLRNNYPLSDRAAEAALDLFDVNDRILWLDMRGCGFHPETLEDIKEALRDNRNLARGVELVPKKSEEAFIRREDLSTEPSLIHASTVTVVNDWPLTPESGQSAIETKERMDPLQAIRYDIDIPADEAQEWDPDYRPPFVTIDPEYSRNKYRELYNARYKQRLSISKSVEIVAAQEEEEIQEGEQEEGEGEGGEGEEEGGEGEGEIQEGEKQEGEKQDGEEDQKQEQEETQQQEQQ